MWTASTACCPGRKAERKSNMTPFWVRLALRFCILLSSQGICVGNVYSHVTDLNLLGNFVLVLWLLHWKLGELSCCILLAVFKRSTKQREWCVGQSFSTFEQELPSNLQGHTGCKEQFTRSKAREISLCFLVVSGRTVHRWEQAQTCSLNNVLHG